MNIKKIVTSIFALTIIGTTVTTSVMAYTKKEAYNVDYNYKGNSNNLSWNYIGGSSVATTAASNSSSNKVSRYIYVNVEKRNVSSNKVLAKNYSEITTKNAGTACSVSRNRTDKSVYFRHYAKIKTDKDNSVVIYTSPDYRVYQKGN